MIFKLLIYLILFLNSKENIIIFYEMAVFALCVFEFFIYIENFWLFSKINRVFLKH